MPAAFRVRPVGLEGVSPPVDEKVKVARYHAGGRSKTKIPHSLLPEEGWTGPQLYVGGETLEGYSVNFNCLGIASSTRLF
jgi:hypothetical protein